MPKITYIAFDGNETTVDAKEGMSVMQTVVNNGVDGIKVFHYLPRPDQRLAAFSS